MPESAARPLVAYFSMEFGLHEEFHSYAGGLGVLAGDFMKSAGDLGLPVVGVGLRWAEGYTVQRIGEDGYPYDEWREQPAEFLDLLLLQPAIAADREHAGHRTGHREFEGRGEIVQMAELPARRTALDGQQPR